MEPQLCRKFIHVGRSLYSHLPVYMKVLTLEVVLVDSMLLWSTISILQVWKVTPSEIKPMVELGLKATSMSPNHFPFRINHSEHDHAEPTITSKGVQSQYELKGNP